MATPCEVEGSTHFRDILGRIGAKILRLASLAQDDILGRLSDKLQFDAPALIEQVRHCLGDQKLTASLFLS